MENLLRFRKKIYRVKSMLASVGPAQLLEDAVCQDIKK